MTGDQYQTLLGELRRSAEETRHYVDESIQRSAEETRRYVDRSAEETRKYVDSSAEETRRLFGVIAEELRGQIQLVAEGVSFCGPRSEAVRQEAAAEDAEIRSQLRTAFGQLDRRVTGLEGSVEDLSTRVGRLEAPGAR
jgi:hypothetical protein